MVKKPNITNIFNIFKCAHRPLRHWAVCYNKVSPTNAYKRKAGTKALSFLLLKAKSKGAGAKFFCKNKWGFRIWTGRKQENRLKDILKVM